MGTTINIDQMSKAIAETMRLYGDSLQHELEEVEKEVAKETVRTIKDAITFNGTEYRKHITHTAIKKKQNRTYCYVWGGSKDYRLTHLLEYGHALVKGGRSVGHTKAFPHFIDGQRYVEENYVKALKRKVESR